MKTATVRDLRKDFGRISKWLDSGETVQILKRGKPFARVLPEPAGKNLLGCMEGTGELPADPEAETGIQWEAMS
jgi:antitoxin (DNA-binding transcriptional repressor) of toxin-antitoxin stability system